MPNSGEQDDQTAPRLTTASMAITVSGRFGMYPATRSPAATPASRSDPARLATLSNSSP